MIKKIVFTLFSIFLTYRSFALVQLINNTDPSQINWKWSIGISIALNLFITGIFAFVGFAFLTSKILPNSYYQIKNSKKVQLIYKRIGVEYFKILLLKFFWGREKNRKKYFDGTKTGIDNFDTQTRQSEFGHLAALIVIFIVSLFLLVKGYLAIFLVTTFVNFISNFYPIVLQRSHRIQIERLKLIMARKLDK